MNLCSNGKNLEKGLSIKRESYQCSEYAVYIRNLCKRYGNDPPVVQNLCMRVRKGSIYGLLGSSGCGKTTVLSFIVGLKKWDSGEILVFGEKPGSKESGIPGRRLGYMPQDIGLYSYLSIREVIQFYGRIYSMKNADITLKWNFLKQLLQIPDVSNKPIKDLSGGQKRRASLALALIHSPELIVLDEPTVGLDPLLHTQIWKHLHNIVRTLGTTIIITTHYMEEARLSNEIGIMRKGRLIVEETPVNLLQRYRCEFLDKVVLQLCQSDEHNLQFVTNGGVHDQVVTFKSAITRNETVDSSVGVSNKEHKCMNGVFRRTDGFDCDMNQDLGPAIEVERKVENNDTILRNILNFELFQTFRKTYGLTVVLLMPLLRHPLFLALVIILPAAQGVITILALGSKPIGLNFGIVNYELADWTIDCDFKNNSGDSCKLSAMSCQYLNQLRSTDLIVLDAYENEDDAHNQVQLGNIWGYMIFPNNYSEHTVNFAAAKQFATNETIEGSRIHVHLDQSEYVASFLIIKHLFTSYLEYIKQLGIFCQISELEAVVPLIFRTPVYGDYEDNYITFIVPGAMMSSLLIILSLLTSVLFIMDRIQGTLSRAHVAGLATADVMMGYILTVGIIAVIQIIVWALIVYIFFDFVVAGSMWLCFLLCLLVAIASIAYGLLFGVIFDNIVENSIFGIFSVPFFLLYGGVFWPTESMSKFWQYFGYIIPNSLPTMSLRSVTVRGLWLTHPLVWPGILSSLIWFLVLMIGTVIGYRRLFR